MIHIMKDLAYTKYYLIVSGGNMYFIVYSLIDINNIDKNYKLKLT